MADTKISDETSAGTLDGTEIVPVVRNAGGSPVTYVNRRTTAQDIADRAGMKLISTQIASASALLEWTGLSGYDYYELVCANLIPASAGANLRLQYGTGGTPTYQTTNYQYGAAVQGTSGGYSSAALEGQASIELFGNIATTLGVSGRATFIIGGAQILAHIGGLSNGTHWYEVITHGVWTGGTALTALKLFMSTGNIASGKASLYGMRS